MNTPKKQPPSQNNRISKKQNTQNRGNQKHGIRNAKPRLSLAKVLQDLSPSLATYLEKSADNQEKIVDADMRIANSVSKLTERLVSEGPNIKFNIYPGPMRKKSKKSHNTHHQRVKKIILTMRKKLKTYEEIARFLEKEDIPTFTKRGRWHAQTVHRLYQDYPES